MAKAAYSCLGYVKQSIASRWREVTLSLFPLQSWTPRYAKRTLTYWSESSEGHEDDLGTGASDMWMRQRAGIVKPGEKKVYGDFIKVVRRKWSKEGEARFFSVTSCEKIRGNGNKLKHNIFRLNIRKKVFIMRV